MQSHWLLSSMRCAAIAARASAHSTGGAAAHTHAAAAASLSRAAAAPAAAAAATHKTSTPQAARMDTMPRASQRALSTGPPLRRTPSGSAAPAPAPAPAPAAAAASLSFGRPLSLEWPPKPHAAAQSRRLMHTHARHRSSSQTPTAHSTQDKDRKQEQHEHKQEEAKQEQQTESDAPPTNPLWAFVAMLRRAFEWYAHKLDTHPIKTQGLTSGTLFALGDWTAQRYEVQLDAAKGIDVSDRPYIDFLRLAACTSFGLFVLGPCGHHWYSRLDVYTNRLYAPRSWKNVGLKVALDTAIFNPIFLVIFFTSVSLIEGLTLKDIGYKLYRDFVPSYAVDCSIWPPIQTINFRFVPVKFQLLVVNLGCYFDDVFLSYVQHNGMPFIFQRIEHAWLEYIGDDGSSRSDHGAHGSKAVVSSAADDAEPIREVMPHAPHTSAEDATVILVKSSQQHPHHPHSHPIHGSALSPTPLPHHHIVPRVLAEDAHRLPRHHGVDVGLVEELDADWTDVPANGNKSKGQDSGKDSSGKASPPK